MNIIAFIIWSKVIDYIIAKDGHKLYKASCLQCSASRGYKLKKHIVGICRSCSSVEKTLKHGNPMLGKKHLNRERFRKNTHSNVDYNDFRIEYNKSGNKRTKFRQKCPTCNIDVGYRIHLDAARSCVVCKNKKVTCYTSEHKRIRCSMKANLVARLKSRLLSKNKKSTFDILNYTVDDLKLHLESKFQEGMSWENYGEWEIDHIIPDSWFSYNSIYDEDFKKSWSLDNLQPLWKYDNAAKGNRYEG